MAGVCSLALSGCIPAAAGLALSAASLITGGGSGGKGGEAFSNPIDRQTTGRQIRQALSRMDDQVDPNCQAMLDEHQKTHGTLTAGTAVESTDPVPEKPSDSESAADGAATDKTTDLSKKTPPPVNLLAKLEPDAADTNPAGADDPVNSAETVDAAETAATSDAVDAADPETKPVKASLGPKSRPAPGHCEHRFVCLPGTPKPTMMLMCPGKGGGKLEAEKTMANADSAGLSEDNSDVASVGDDQQPSAASRSQSEHDQTETAALKSAADGEGSMAASSSPADSQPVADTAVSADAAPPRAVVEAVPEINVEPARRTIEGGGVADWNWSYDPAKQL